jgi:pseudouridine-5'-phosphate glycosidase
VSAPALRTAPEVADAIAMGAPVVALESTIISHGMPYPTNVEMANEIESLVRRHGAVPATIAVLGGSCLVGLEATQLEHLATAPDVHKATTRDLPWLLASGRDGATTVAATMRVAALAGIAVFATGGIGGVHRGAAATMDVSADLTELSVTPVAVISAGIKSILDIGLSLERLETLGVPVVVNGSDDFPAFYSRRSGFPAPRRADGAVEIAALMHAAWDALELRAGISVANPIPVEDEIPAEEIDSVIADALCDLDARGITGQDVTPFLLSQIVDRTSGRSLRANLALVRNNAVLASQVAVAYAAMR